MEIEVGEYIRTKNGEIAKVIYNATNEFCDKERLALDRVVSVNNSEFIYRDDIVKHSKNIIDLLEVGDIVNIIISLNRHYEEPVETTWYIIDKIMLINVKNRIETGEIKLISILTKEQYEQNSYKL